MKAQKPAIVSLSPVPDAERVARLRAACLDRKRLGRSLNCAVVDCESFKNSEGIKSIQLRIGMRTRDRLSTVQFAIDDLEILAGRIFRPAADPDEFEKAKAYLGQFPFKSTPGQTGHCELERRRLFELGIDGLMDEIRARKKTAMDEKAGNVYQSFLYALEGLSCFAEHAGETARNLAKKASKSRRDELKRIVDACMKIAHAPPSSFYEAIQLLWLVDLAVMHGDNVAMAGPGHIDRTLGPFYENDLRSGKITRERALLLIESLYLLINEYVPDGLAMPVMVGGRNANGEDVTNDLSYLCLEALRRTKLVYPTVGVCWHEKTPPQLVALAVDLIVHGYSNPAFFGDATIQRGLAGYGVPPPEACNYINSTCVEITPVGASNVWVASPYFPVCKILLDEIGEQCQTRNFSPTFDDFMARYMKRLGGEITASVVLQNELRERRRQFGGKPLQSVFTNDCIERGRDIDDGGARYNWIECSFVGLANLADSLNVIKNEIFDGKRMDFRAMKAILDSNFEGREPERVRFLQGHQKYGNDDAGVDEIFQKMIVFVRDECRKHSVLPGNAHFVPGAFCWVMHERLGRECGATPDGRKAGTPFADGCGPAQGRERNGPTSAIKSTTSWDHAPMIGGLAYNMKFNTSLLRTDNGITQLKNLVLAFLRRGGFETQVNVVDNETLKKARANPEQYRDLVVRIGGYTDYFTRLSPEMQDEIMMRTEFNVF